ncbi:MAG: OmpA family protein [Deltaproteobacteria bacterium]|jgi:outer membrane protein OmpA-like peptidoglycan-associated protein|nr:OmpA family protein [Deltaproteobacteria bacterium]
MLTSKDIRAIAVFSVAIWFLSGCATSHLKIEPIPTSENPIEHINRLDNDTGNARKNQVNVLAPTSFAKAETFLNDAKKTLDRGGELSEILEMIASGRAQLKNAEEMAQLSRTTLPDVIKARDLSRSAGATNFEEDYAKVEEQFLGLTKAIENNNVKYARRNRTKVTDAYDQLELRAIKERTISVARELINQAKKGRAQKIAPKSFAVAQERLKEADAFISAHRYEKEKIHEKASEALFQARRLLEVTSQSEQVRTMQPEQITLWVEGILHKTASKLSAPDMRDNSFDTQVENILGSITVLQEDQQFMVNKMKALSTEIEAMKKQIASLEGQTLEKQAAKDRLAAEKRFNQLFGEVQNYFTPDEAEVYKQGNRLIIRLRAIQFPVGQAVIMPDNYSLLSKVQRSIRTFGEPDVVIEGHTDSTGSDEVNEHLSQQRAEAVRQYFVANRTLPDENIIAVGYGSKRPLASNASPEGRAINRRIDVIISPQPQTTGQ